MIARPAPDPEDVYRALADARRWLESGAEEVKIQRTRRGGLRVLGTSDRTPALDDRELVGD